MNDNTSIRWSFNSTLWNPSESEWNLALASLESIEEVERISKFKRPQPNNEYLIGRFNPDAKSSCAGRLMLKRMLRKINVDSKSNNMKLLRTKLGKPYLERNSCEFFEKFPHFNFNLSHHGDWVVLASDPNHLVGVDVMKIEKRRNESTTDFFEIMKNCFTNSEWKVIKQQTLKEYEQLSQFYTHWTLKESYIKAIGIGLGFDLQSCSFSISNDQQTAQISIHSQPLNSNWMFHIYPESQFAKEHIVSVGFGPISDDLSNNEKTKTNVINNDENNFKPQHLPFEQLTFAKLMEN